MHRQIDRSLDRSARAEKRLWKTPERDLFSRTRKPLYDVSARGAAIDIRRLLRRTRIDRKTDRRRLARPKACHARRRREQRSYARANRSSGSRNGNLGPTADPPGGPRRRDRHGARKGARILRTSAFAVSQQRKKQLAEAPKRRAPQVALRDAKGRPTEAANAQKKSYSPPFSNTQPQPPTPPSMAKLSHESAAMKRGARHANCARHGSPRTAARSQHDLRGGEVVVGHHQRYLDFSNLRRQGSNSNPITFISADRWATRCARWRFARTQTARTGVPRGSGCADGVFA